MTVEERCNVLFEVFQKVSLLADKNDAKTLRVRHKTSEKDFVLHILPSANTVYEFLCGIRQDNLPTVYEVFTLTDGAIVLEEYINGLTVAQITETGRYRKNGAVRIVKELCKALEVLHSNGIVHRDIKPENIMVDKNGRVVLIDFNAARKISAKSQDTVIMGTVGYASPEQLGLAQSDERTDIYALGVLLNVLLTGVHPNEQIARGYLGRVVRKCTHINAGERYQTSKQLSHHLNFILYVFW